MHENSRGSLTKYDSGTAIYIVMTSYCRYHLCVILDAYTKSFLIRSGCQAIVTCFVYEQLVSWQLFIALSDRNSAARR